MKFLIFIPAILNGALYRMGGSGNFPRWTRPVGIASMTMLAMWILGLWHWSVIPSAGIMAGVSTTYFKRPGWDAYWWNWLFAGLSFGLAMMPYAYFTGQWLEFFLRTAVCTGLVCAWSEFIGWDIAEEAGRGFIAIVTLSIFLIGG